MAHLMERKVLSVEINAAPRQVEYQINDSKFTFSFYSPDYSSLKVKTNLNQSAPERYHVTLELLSKEQPQQVFLKTLIHGNHVNNDCYNELMGEVDETLRYQKSFIKNGCFQVVLCIYLLNDPKTTSLWQGNVSALRREF